MSASTASVIRNGAISANATGQTWINAILIYDECTNSAIEHVRAIGNYRSAVRADQGTGESNLPATALFSLRRLKQGSFRHCYFAGNSASSAG